MPKQNTAFGYRDPRDLGRSGRALVVCGIVLASLGVILLAIPILSLIVLAVRGIELIQYARFMLEAQLFVHAVIAAILFIPAALLIGQGRKRLRASVLKDESNASIAA